MRAAGRYVPGVRDDGFQGTRNMQVRWMRAAALALLLAAAGCGGGGGGGEGLPGDAPGGDVTGVVTIEFTPTEISTFNVEGQPTSTPAFAVVNYTGTGTVYFVFEELNGVVVDVKGSLSLNTLAVNLHLNPALPPGIHTTEVLLHACLDENCERPLRSPARLPLRFEVQPNIGLPAALALQRAGREAAPAATVPVTVPAAAGPLLMQVSSLRPEAFDVVFDGSQLQVRTRQERAGTYRATVLLQSEIDVRYRRTMEITYTVDPPPGGEQELLVSERWVYVTLQQGTTATRRIQVTRPTWTDVLDPPELLGATGLLQLRDLGNDEFEVTLDGRGQALESYSSSIALTAGPTGGRAVVTYNTSVVAAFYALDGLGAELHLASTPADLRRTTPVLTFDGVPQRWSASSNTPWLRLVTTQGTTGVDDLVAEIDPAALPAMGSGESGEVVLSIDRPGTTPFVLRPSVSLRIPRLQFAGMRALAGDHGRLYVEGHILQNLTVGSSVGGGALKVAGARLVDAAIVTDHRFVGDVSVLRVDVADAVPGRDIVVRVESPLMPSQVSVAVEAPAAVPAGHAVLPFGSYRPPQYAPGLDALYFAGSDSVYRWAHDATSWRLESVASPGVIDVAVRPDEQVLYTINGALGVHGLDPVTLAETGQGALHQVMPDFDDSDFDPEAPIQQRALAYSADFRPFAPKRRQAVTGLQQGVDWLMPATTGDLLSTPRWGGPGNVMENQQSGGALAAGVVRSAGGHAVLAQYPSGGLRLYRPEARAWVGHGSVPANVPLVAVSEDAAVTVASDGTLRNGTSVRRLSYLMPDTHDAAGGYGLTPDGRFALMYGYRVAFEAGMERARDATLWVVDLRGDPDEPVQQLPLLAALPLPDAVGCIGPLAAGEFCHHTASVVVTEDAASAFVAGPRGVVAVALPDVVRPVPLRSTAAGNAAALPPRRFPVRGALQAGPPGP
jgi:hypothetical protein